MQPDMVEELRTYREEVEDALRNGDMAGLREIVERAGLTWIDARFSETCMTDTCCQTSHEGQNEQPMLESVQGSHRL